MNPNEQQVFGNIHRDEETGEMVLNNASKKPIPGYIKLGDGTTSVAASHLTNGNYALTCRKMDEQLPVGTRLPVEKYSGHQLCIEVTNAKAAMVLLQCAASLYHLMEVHERTRAGESLGCFASTSTVAGHPPKASL